MKQEIKYILYHGPDKMFKHNKVYKAKPFKTQFYAILIDGIFASRVILKSHTTEINPVENPEYFI